MAVFATFLDHPTSLGFLTAAICADVISLVPAIAGLVLAVRDVGKEASGLHRDYGYFALALFGVSITLFLAFIYANLK